MFTVSGHSAIRTSALKITLVAPGFCFNRTISTFMPLAFRPKPEIYVGIGGAS